MSIDTTPLGQLTAETMAAIEEAYDGDYHIRTAVVIAEVDSPTQGQIVVRCSDDRVWLLEALLHEAESSVIEQRAALKAMPERGSDDGE